MLGATLLMALREVRRNALRSFLTMLGVVIGVGAVIVLVTLGEGASARVRSDIAKLGENLLIVSTGSFRRGPASTPARPFSRADAEVVVREIAGLSGIAPAASRQMLVVAGSRNWRTNVTGTTEEFLQVRSYRVASGRGFGAGEGSSGRAVCLLGQTVVEELFGAQDPLGQTVRLGRTPCEVIGTLAEKGEAGMGQDQDDLVVMPLVAFQRRIAGNSDITNIYVSAQRGRPTTLVKSQLEALMRERRRTAPGEDADFAVRDMAEIAATMASATGALAALLGAIAAVSLLVGGIGIMNIMLVSVTERTREIGIRLSIGALPKEVLLQFLVEAAVLSSIGGVIGILLGVGGSALAARALDVPFVIVPRILVIAFLFSAVVGVLFGLLPARRAARLNPIDALRHEEAADAGRGARLRPARRSGRPRRANSRAPRESDRVPSPASPQLAMQHHTGARQQLAPVATVPSSETVTPLSRPETRCQSLTQPTWSPSGRSTQASEQVMKSQVSSRREVLQGSVPRSSALHTHEPGTQAVAASAHSTASSERP